MVSCWTFGGFASIQIGVDFDFYLDANSDRDASDQEEIESVGKHFGRENLMFLLLFTRTVGEYDPSFDSYGLLLLLPSPEALSVHRHRREWKPELHDQASKAWACVGVCQIGLNNKIVWNFEKLNRPPKTWPDLEIFRGKTDDWRNAQGLFR